MNRATGVMGNPRQRVLILTYHFPPSAASGGFRMLGFARHLPSFGWDVSVVAPPTMPWESVDPDLLDRVPPETLFHPAPFPHGRLSLPALLCAGVTIWLPRGYHAARRAVWKDRPDVVLTSGPPHWVHLLGLRLKARYGLPWVADFRDPWVEGAEWSGSKLTRAWNRLWERRVMRAADLIVANTPLGKEYFCRSFPGSADRVVSITNGFDPETFESDAVRLGQPSQVTVVHTGMIYAGRDAIPLLDAIAALRSSGSTAWDFRAIFVGRVEAAGQKLAAEAQARGLERVVEVRGPVPYRTSVGAMKGADILLLLDSPNRTMGVPAKLYEYIGARRPILALADTDSDTARILRSSGVTYRVAPPNDSAAIARAMSDLAAVAGSGGQPVGSGRSPESYTRHALAGQLAKELEDLLTGRRIGAPARKRSLEKLVDQSPLQLT